MARPSDAVIAILSVAAIGVALLAYRGELRARAPIDQAIEEFELDLRRPADVEVLRFQPAADLRASFLSNMSLADVYSPVRLANMSSEERGRWIRSLSTLDDQLARSRDLTLDALAQRPGWAFHHAYAGEVEYAALRRRSFEAAAVESARWEIPLRNGIDLAQGNLSFPSYLGGAMIETWEAAELKADPLEVLAQAMKTRAFVSRNYRLVTIILGHDPAMSLLPDDPGILRIAFAREKRDREVVAAAALRLRIDGAERRTRAEDLESIRERRRLGDVQGRQAAAAMWVGRHKPEDLDDAQGRAEVAEVLELWPESKRGSWLRDPRARLIRYLLSGREDAVAGEVLLRTVRMLTDVPEPIVGRALALAGQTWEADRLLSSSGTRGSFEWTPVIVDLARTYAWQDKPDRARDAVSQASGSALDECNMLLVRREVAEEKGEANEVLEALTPDELPPAMWSRTGALSLCIDPARYGKSDLVVSLASTESSLVSYGWDGGRLESVVVDGESTITVPLSGRNGRHPFGITTEVGPRVEILGGRIVSRR